MTPWVRRAVKTPNGGVVSVRQMHILGRVAAGLTNAEIAAELHVGECTVKTHLRRLYRTVGARNAPHAVAICCGWGWRPERAS